jgi:DNA-directed RNA polymerase subunit M/transcription elongation factor TFIIS
MNQFDVVYNVECEECGTKLLTAEVRENGKVICEQCLYPRPPSSSYGNTENVDWEDDPSGFWDNAVKIYEGE